MTHPSDDKAASDPYACELWQQRAKQAYRAIVRDHGPGLHTTLISAGRIHLVEQGVDLSSQSMREIADSAIAYAMVVSARQLLEPVVDADQTMRAMLEDVLGKLRTIERLRKSGKGSSEQAP